MAKITYGPIVSQGRGKVGDIVLNRNRGGNFARALNIAAPPVGEHNLLSATHLDTTPATPPAKGSIITGQGLTAAWQELALGADGQLLGSDGVDALWVDSPSPLKAAQTADVTVLGNAAESTLLSLAGSATIPANSAAIGTTYRVTLMGHQTRGATSNQYIQLKLYLGGTLLYTGNTALQAAAGTRAFAMVFLVTFRTIGNPGTVIAQGHGYSMNAANAIILLDSITPPTATTNINTTANQAIDAKVLWSGPGQANNSITCTNATIERLAL